MPKSASNSTSRSLFSLMSFHILICKFNKSANPWIPEAPLRDSKLHEFWIFLEICTKIYNMKEPLKKMAPEDMIHTIHCCFCAGNRSVIHVSDNMYGEMSILIFKHSSESYEF